MIRVDEARVLMLDALRPLDVEEIEYSDSLSRVLAAPLIAARTQPPFAASAMDGYAVRSGDLSDGETSLRLVGESAAGQSWSGTVGAGEAVRISTGAPVPAGADQVVIQEKTRRDDDTIRIDERPRARANIRSAGVDFQTWQSLLPPGTVLTPDAIALTVSAGQTRVSVYRRPRVGILSTGNELVEPGEMTGPDQIINSVSKGLDGLVRQAGAEPVYLGIARDDPDHVRDRLSAGRDLDLVVTIGGASVGDHDHLRQVFADEGGALVFEKIAIKPGKPTWFGALDGTPFLGLPGNPVSAMVIARLFLRPAIARLSGHSEPPVFETVELGADLPANGPRETYVRAFRDPVTGQVSPVDNQDSSVMVALVRSDVLIRREIDAAEARAGDRLPALRV